MTFLFWLFLALLGYTYFGYPLLLVLCRIAGRPRAGLATTVSYMPSVAIILPVYNEERIIGEKIKNIRALAYPDEKLSVVIVSDGSTDRTEQIVKQHEDRVELVAVPARRGKANALNAGIKAADTDIVVFSDASIMLMPEALGNIVAPFQNAEIGCVSGEDHIPEGGGGEGFYGRYELFLRNLESRVSSVVGASGCFYAQRRILCRPFIEGMAPDFLSVLATVENGYRAVTCPSAVGYMRTVSAPRDEYTRKERTFIRGITTLLHYKKMLNPLKYGFFAVELISHKLMRWFSGLFLIGLFLSNLFLLGKPFYAIFFLLQCVFYLMAFIGWKKPETLNKFKILKLPFFFCLVNAAALSAWIRYFGGIRQEIWEPSKR